MKRTLSAGLILCALAACAPTRTTVKVVRIDPPPVAWRDRAQGSPQPIEGAAVSLVNGNLEELVRTTGPAGTTVFEFDSPDAMTFISCWVGDTGPVSRVCVYLVSGSCGEVVIELPVPASPTPVATATPRPTATPAPSATPAPTASAQPTAVSIP
nr:hypothetical protein [bacterium]